MSSKSLAGVLAAIVMARRGLSAEHPVLTAADTNLSTMTAAVQHAFMKGRKALGPANAGASKRAAAAIRSALLEVMPAVLMKMLKAGGNAGLSVLGKKLRAAQDVRAAGGPGSGNFGHGGRPGEVGGSSTASTPDTGELVIAKELGLPLTYHGSDSKESLQRVSVDNPLSKTTQVTFEQAKRLPIMVMGSSKDVAIADLKSTQDYIQPSAVKNYRDGFYMKAQPIVATIHGEEVLLNGNHNVLAEKLSGKTTITVQHLGDFSQYADYIKKVDAKDVRTLAFDPNEPRDEKGQWTEGSSSNRGSEKDGKWITHGISSGYVTKPKAGYILNEEALKTSDGAEQEFHRAIEKQYPQGLVVFHESPVENASSLKRQGLPDDSFATIGHPSDFITSHDKAVVEANLTPDQSRKVSPDMRYDPENPYADLLRQHSGVYGADISLNQRLRRDEITVSVKKAGKLALLASQDIRTLAGPFKMQFNVADPRASEWVRKHAAELADQVSQTTADAIERVAEALDFDPETDRGELEDAIGDDARAEMIARTETLYAANEGQRQGWDQAVDEGLLTGDEKRVWIATSGACDICDELDGETTDLDGEYPDPGGDGPPQHPNCLLPGNTISGRIIAGMRSRYKGPAFEIKTSNGNLLRLTGQHPVLTAQGWVQAATLREGCKLLCQVEGIKDFGGVNDYQRPSLVENVFETLRVHGSTPIDIGRLDLHGDARWVDGKVDVVGAYRPQRLNAEISSTERIGEVGFPFATMVEAGIVSTRALDSSFERINSPPSTFPSPLHLADDQTAVLFEPLPFQVLLLGLASELNVVLPELARQDASANAAFILELQERSAGFIAFDEVVDVREFDFSGHVYDLQADVGWIIAQNIVISNCRCTEGLTV